VHVKLDSDVHPKVAKGNLDGQTHRFTLRFLLIPSVEDIPAISNGTSSRPLLVVLRLAEQ
jgi:hypothetical protein